jgi:hypothetical protein
MVDREVITEIRDTLRGLDEAVRGNSLGNPGLIKRVATLETSDSAHTQKFILWGGIVTGISIAAQSLHQFFKK